MTRRQNRMFFKIGFSFLGAAAIAASITLLYHTTYGASPIVGELIVIAISILSMVSFYFIFGLGILPRVLSFFLIYGFFHKKKDYYIYRSDLYRFVTLIIDDPLVRKELAHHMTMEERVKAGLA